VASTLSRAPRVTRGVRVYRAPQTLPLLKVRTPPPCKSFNTDSVVFAVSELKRTMSSLPASASKKSKGDTPEVPIDLTGDDEEVEEYPCFFGDFGDDDDHKKVVKLGVTRLNLIFNSEVGPFAYIMNFTSEAPDETMLDKLHPKVGDEDTTTVELRKAALDKKIEKWLGKAAKAKIEEVRLIMSSLRSLKRLTPELDFAAPRPPRHDQEQGL
jgi:hypothetical protein